MTLQNAFIKSHFSPRSTFAGARVLVELLVFAISERSRHRRESQAFHCWMQHEHALQDLGCSANDVGRPLWRELDDIPLGCLGSASLIFQNNAGGKAFATHWMTRLGANYAG